MNARYVAFVFLSILYLAYYPRAFAVACGAGAQIKTVTVGVSQFDVCVSSASPDYSRVAFPSAWFAGLVAQSGLPKGVSVSAINIGGELGRVVRTDSTGVDYSWSVDYVDTLGNRYARTVSAAYSLDRFFSSENPRVVLRVVRAALEDLGAVWIDANGFAPGSSLPMDAGHRPFVVNTSAQNSPLADPLDHYPPEPILYRGSGINKPNPDKIYARGMYGNGRACLAGEVRDIWSQADMDTWGAVVARSPEGVTVDYFKPGVNQVVAVKHGVGGRPVTPCAEGDQTVLWMTACSKYGDPCTYGYVCSVLVSCASWRELTFAEIKSMVASQPDLLKAILPKIGVRDSKFVDFGNSPGDGQVVNWPFTSPVVDWDGFAQPFAPISGGVGGGGVVKPVEQPTKVTLDWSLAFGTDYANEGANPPVAAHVVDLPTLAGQPWTDRSCPPPRKLAFSIAGKSFENDFDFGWACWWLGRVRPIFVSAGAVAAIAIFVRALRGGE